MKKPVLTSFAMAVLFFVSPLFAATDSTVDYAPYADMTINTYWDPNYQDMEPMDLSVVTQKSGIKNYHLAFITDAGQCQPAWGGQSSFLVSQKWGTHLTDKLRKNSINYIVSFGGASGTDISSTCSASDLIAAYENVIATYQPQGLDFDIENGTINLLNLTYALQQIQKAHPTLSISFTLPVMPEGLTDQGIGIVKAAKRSNLNFSVNIMAMDYGPAYANDMGQYATQAATNVFNTLKIVYPEKSDADVWKMIEVTPMIGVNDVQPEEFTLKDVDILRDFANQNHLGRLAIWSVARDNPCADKYASPICSGDNLQKNPYDFSKRFLGNAKHP